MVEQQTTWPAASSPTALEDYRAAEAYVNGLIFGPPSPPVGTPPEIIRERAAQRLDRLRRFLAFLGNPQRRYRVVHVGGTSGKGSTTVMIGNILHAAGHRVGVHVSPYLQASTEKLVIDGRLISARRYRELVDSMHERVAAWVAEGNERPNYGEFWVAMMLQYFAEERVDVAVIEVGAGGRFDVTNVVEPEVVAITSVGYDHMVTLGSTLPEIAWHKAGIIKPGSVAVTTVADAEALPVIVDEARFTGVALCQLRVGTDWRDVATGPEGTSFIDGVSGARFSVPLAGDFQAANAALAIAACRAFDADAVDDAAIAAGLAATRFPGRLEIMQRSPLVVLDGAHNPEKVGSLVANLDGLFPSRRVIAVVGVLESKSYSEMLTLLGPHVDVLIATAPQVFAKPPVTAADLAAAAASYVAEVVTVPEPLEAVARALRLAETDDLVLVTGSLYLVGNVREGWHPLEAVLRHGTSWPSV
jgi:dihydrofolate synthase/folylpolyglutamate synthase